MKKLNLTFVLIFSLLVTMVSCGKDNGTTPDPTDNSNKIPDAVVKAEVKENGNVVQTIDFTLPKQDMNGGFVASGALNQSIFALSIQELQKWVITMSSTSIGSISIGTHPLSASTGYAHYAESRTSLAQSGTIAFTKVNLYAEAAGVKEYFVDGNFEMEMMDAADTTRHYHITGTFSGVNVKQK